MRARWLWGMMDISLSFIHHTYIQGGIRTSSYEVREDVVEAGLVDAPDYLFLLAHQLQAARDVLLGDSEGQSGLKFVYHLQFPFFPKDSDNWWHSAFP